MIVDVARRATCSPTWASVMGAFSLTSTWMVACCAFAASFSLNEVAADEKLPGMVTTTENSPERRPSRAVSSLASIQEISSPPSSTIAAASWRPIGTY